MLSTSNKVASADDDVVPDRILDAARELVLAVGIRRTTATDVARRAGISRMTLYRRFPHVQRILADLLTREFTELLAAAGVAIDPRQSARQRLCALARAGVQGLGRDPLFARVLQVDPDVLLPYVIDHTGASQRNVLAAARTVIADGHRDGSIRAGDPDLMARSILLTVQSFAFSARVIERESDPRAALDELELLLDRYLAPPA